jgi:hypothetical protein
MPESFSRNNSTSILLKTRYTSTPPSAKERSVLIKIFCFFKGLF